MSCKHPLKAFKIGVTNNGKSSLKVTSKDVHHVELNQQGNWTNIYTRGISPNAVSAVTEFVYIPCGKCLACKLDKSREWANRCMLEMQNHDESYFITLTYDDEHLPMNPGIDKDTGEIQDDIWNSTLVLEDYQKFIKRLRKNTGQNLRFYGCGEYGTSIDGTHRPHYHLIIFGLHLDDLELLGNSNLGHQRYTSETIGKCWKFGHHLVMEATWETCAYTARYVTKKAFVDFDDIYKENNVLPEFSTMSRKPGIGKNYYENHKNLFDFENIVVGNKFGSKKFKPPRYFEKLFEVDNPNEYEILKAKRNVFSDENKKLKLKNTSLNYLDMLKVEEDNLVARTKSLQRKEI